MASAREGADVVLFDRVADIDTVGYPLATPDDLQRSLRKLKHLAGVPSV
jgi:hypothetical protein